MEKWAEIRRRVLVEGVSKRQIMRESGMHWLTLKKILTHSQPPGYAMKEPRQRWKLIGKYVERIKEILLEDKQAPRKQRHSAKRIWERLKQEGYQGGYGVVAQVIRELKQQGKEVYIPLIHRPGEGQVDFGHALARIGGKLRKIAFFVMSLPYSDGFFVKAFERECTETFWQGHVEAFEFFGGVPRRITYDNSKIAVSMVLERRERKLTNGFLTLKSHYLFDHHFCHVRRANEKGVVEATVSYARGNFMVPVPEFESMGGFNDYLLQRCEKDLERRLRGKEHSKWELLEQERESFLALPASRFEACRKASTTASSLSLVRFDGNDYSVPSRYGHHPVVVKGFYDRVELCWKEQKIAEHGRIWDKEQISFEPTHYLRILEKKPGALTFARPLEGWRLAECFGELRKRLEAKKGYEGTREYIGVLRLLENHSMPKLKVAVEKAMALGAISKDGVAQFLYPQQNWEKLAFCMDNHRHLRSVHVQAPDLSRYSSLIKTGGVR